MSIVSECATIRPEPHLSLSTTPFMDSFRVADHSSRIIGPLRADSKRNPGCPYGALAVVVTNSAMGGDPAPSSDKVVMVIYGSKGKEQATAGREGNTVTIP